MTGKKQDSMSGTTVNETPYFALIEWGNLTILTSTCALTRHLVNAGSIRFT